MMCWCVCCCCVMSCQGVLDEVDAAKAIYSVLSALEACHTLSICYGDVKPGNFLLTSMYPSVAHLLDPSKPKGDLKLKAVDFGCAEYCPEGCSLMPGLSGTPGEGDGRPAGCRVLLCKAMLSQPGGNWGSWTGVAGICLQPARRPSSAL